MKIIKLYIIALLIGLSIASQSCSNLSENNSSDKNVTQIKIPNSTFEFGNIHYPDSTSHTFVIRNIGKLPLVIKSAKASCGCTIPTWTKAPIKPGEEGALKVIFKPRKDYVGLIKKSVVIQANTDSIFYVVYLTGNVTSL